MDKVKVSREVAEALDDLFSRKNDNYSNDEILKKHFNALHGDRWSGGNKDYLNELSMSEMAQAMFVGYEVEQTPEEQIIQYVLDRQNAIRTYKALDVQLKAEGKIEGVKFALDTLGIKIEGVNAD